MDWGIEVIDSGNSQWFLDGAHNTLSIGQALEWFSVNAIVVDVPKYAYDLSGFIST